MLNIELSNIIIVGKLKLYIFNLCINPFIYYGFYYLKCILKKGFISPVDT